MNKAHLLKSLITYLAGLDSGALGEIARLGGVTEADTRSFMRLNAGEKALRDAFPGLLAGVGQYLRAAAAPWPYEVTAMASMLFDKAREQRRIPFFLDPPSIRAKMGESGAAAFDQFLDKYQGCWRIFRPSSSTGPTGGVNRWFLNIKPRKSLEKLDQPAPLFSYYFREEKAHQVDDRGKVVGLVFPLAERVTFLGNRLSSFNPHVVAMVWPMGESSREHASHAVGLSLIPNSRREHVASYVWASFIAGSDEWDDETYVRRRREEIDAVARYDLDRKADYDRVTELIGAAQMSQFDKLRASKPIVIG